ncbi:MAG: sodium:calcium symporter [Desulfobacterales bacterium]|nr:sodium:calcium symporter [Desulfobacterales bacterium]
MIWRLGAMERRGFEGTVLGTLIMPYCSGLSNLIFAWVMGRSGQNGSLVLENCLVNNVTNMTLLIGLPSLIWGLAILPYGRKGKPRGRKNSQSRIDLLSLLLTLIAVLFFTGAVWALARDGKLDFGDGLVLVGIFLFWQLFHVFEVLKTNVQKNRSMSWLIFVELAIIIACGYGVYTSIENLVAWIPKTGSGFFNYSRLGWLSGLLMVIPNAMLALYYAYRQRPAVVLSSQVGDGHICIPMCIGLFALFSPIGIVPYFQTGVFLILGACLVQLVFLGILGRLPRVVGALLVGSYFVFLYKGLIS